VDSENYRAKRIDTIISLANKTADKAIKYKRNQSLEPMSAYERRIIHTALADRKNIATYSVGSEPKRKVVISYKG
jgi:spoIIIJ-associated protein